MQLALHLLQKVFRTLPKHFTSRVAVREASFFCFSLGAKTRDQKKGLRRGTVEKETKDNMK